ncbi:tyrosine-type recombinase/integrase [Labilibacter marinus]|uniref:tyrosine-type recombinase/integrase n=1 Tax=Labilibacter marinus TaxID=1477105 RepID=UPI00094FA0B0|nr:tyrosine-type recombinase/integrase [Labilibacter marinus]
MLEVKFYLKSVKPNKEGKQPIIAQIAFNYQKVRKSICKCKPSQWDKKNHRLKLPEVNHYSYDEFAKTNELLQNLKAAIRDLDNKALIEKRKVTEAEIRNILNLDFEKDEGKLDINFFDLFDEYLEFRKTTKAYNTYRGDRTVRNFLAKFEKATKFNMSFSTIDVTFADKLMRYCFLKEKIDNDYFVKIANVLKRYMEWSAKRGLYDINKFPKEELLSIKEKETDVVFLSLEELMILNNWNFKLERLSQARDLFCFAAFTGFRHSDAHTLLPEHIENGMVSKTTEKTHEGVKVPLNKHAKNILNKYIDEVYPLKQISNQKANDYIKECCKEIADNYTGRDIFKRKVVKVKISGRKITQEIKPLYEAITFHIARKTFITNSLMLGANLQAIQEMGAPKKPQHLKKYLKITDAFKSKVMRETWDTVE